MKYGDLSNVVAPRLLIVFEGAVGTVPADQLKLYDKAVAKKTWFAAIGYYELNEPILQRILWLTYAKDFNISLVTWLGEEAASRIEERMSVESIPVRSCFSSTPDQLARMLPYNPDIRCIYDPVPEHILKFGSKGSVLTTPNQIGSMFR
jgi:hypothetical protein